MANKIIYDIFNTDNNKDSSIDDEVDDCEDFYSILGCNPTSTKEQIVSEYRIRALQLHPDKAQSVEDKLERKRKFCKLSYAKEILTDATKRRNYDRWRESGLKISFNKWTSLSNQCQTSIHWMNNKRNQPKAITTNDQIQSNSNMDSIQRFRSNQTSNEYRGESKTKSDKILQMFRNYEI